MNKNEIWDPWEIGPFDRCTCCFTPIEIIRKNNPYSFCPICGENDGVFDTPIIKSNIVCAAHTHKKAVGYCCICGQAICEECKTKEHFSFTAGMRNIVYCKECSLKQRKIQSNFKSSTQKKNRCNKHKNDARFKCKDCSSLLCEHCSYFIRKGWFKKILGDGPFCLKCFRSNYSNRQSKWISGMEALELSLINNE